MIPWSICKQINEKKNIVITGANRGLGLYLAKEFLIEGHNLVYYQEQIIFKKTIYKKQLLKIKKIIFAKLDLEKKMTLIKLKILSKKKIK